MYKLKFTKKSKYKSKKTTLDGVIFDSNAEAEFYQYLLTKYDKKHIKLQPKFELLPSFLYNNKKIKPITYIADFQIDNVVIDVKGMETETFKLKAKMFKYKYPELELQLVKKAPKWHTEPFIELELYNKLKKEGNKKCIK